jgi:membrane protein
MKLFLAIQILKNIFNSSKYYVKGLYKKADSHHIFLIGGGLAFSVFTCLLPMILIIFALLGILIEIPAIKENINTLIDVVIPYEKSSEFIKQIIFERINEFRIFKSLSGSLGIIGIFFAASGLFSSMRTILNTVFEINEGRNILVNKLQDFGMILVVVIFVLFSFAIFPGLDILIAVFDKIPFINLSNSGAIYQNIFSVLLSVFSFFMIFILSFALYYLIPYQKLPKRVISLSSIFTALFWLIAKEIFGYYITHAATLDRVYGTYVFIVISFFWIYYSSIVFIAGAEVGQLYREKNFLNQKTPE